MTKEEIFKFIGCDEIDLSLDNAIAKYAKDRNLCQVLFFDSPTYTLFYKCKNGNMFKIDHNRENDKVILDTFEVTTN